MGNLKKQNSLQMPHHKAVIAGLGAAAALTGAALMYKAPSDVKLFADDKLTDHDYKFMAYVSEYGKSYGTVAEFMFRKEVFVTRHNEIEAFNADANNTHTVGHNIFSDKTFAEMKKLNGYKPVARESNAVHLDESSNAASVDWRTKNNAVHAGPSPPPLPLKELMPSRLEPLNPSLSNNSSPAPSKTVDAMVDSWTTLSNTSRPLHSSSRPPTHTLPELEELLPAAIRNPPVLVPSPLSTMSNKDLPPK